MATSPEEYSRAMSDVESGYASAESSEESLTEVFFTKPHLKFLNKQLQELEPQEILKWAILSIPNLYQTTAFGLTGLVTIDMLSKLSTSSPIDLIFFDTLHHFNETLELVQKVQTRYPHIKLHIFKPQDAHDETSFAAAYGEKLWETDDERYDWLAKVEPAQRAYAELNVKAALTGRRKSQGGKRGDLDIIEIDEAGLIKINPLANWSFKEVQNYIKENNVPYNELLDMGYKSVGDWHSTQPVADGEDERAGRWKGKAKTECGIHNSRSRYAQYLQEQEQLKAQQKLAETIVAAATDGSLEQVQVVDVQPVQVAEIPTTGNAQEDPAPVQAILETVIESPAVEATSSETAPVETVSSLVVDEVTPIEATPAPEVEIESQESIEPTLESKLESSFAVANEQQALPLITTETQESAQIPEPSPLPIDTRTEVLAS